MRFAVAAVLAASCLLPARAQDAPAPGWREILRLDDKAVIGIGFSPDGRRLAVSGRDYARVLSFPDGKTLDEFRQAGLVDEALYSHDGKYLATRSLAEDTRLRDTIAYDLVKFGLDTPVAEVPTVARRPPPGSRSSDCPGAFSPDGRWLALANGSKGIRFWNLEELGREPRLVLEIDISELETDTGRRTGIPERMMLPHVNAITFAGPTCWLGFEGGFAYPLPMTRVEAELSRREVRGNRAPAPPTAEQFERAVRDRDVRRTSFRTLEQKRCFRPHSGHVTSVEPVGDLLVTAGWEGKVRFWTPGPELSKLHDERNNEERPRPAKPVAELPGYVATASPGRDVLAVAEAWKVVLYDPKTRAEKQRIEAPPSLGRPVRMRFSPDGANLAVTYCCCTECVDDGVLRLTSAPPKRVHHHGGVLVVYSRCAPTPTGGK